MGKFRKQGGVTSKDNNQPRQLSLSLHTKQSTTDLISCLKSQVFEWLVYTTKLKYIVCILQKWLLQFHASKIFPSKWEMT